MPNSHVVKSILKICLLKYKLNQILSSKISKSFQYVKQRYFEFGDEPQSFSSATLEKQPLNVQFPKLERAQENVSLPLGILIVGSRHFMNHCTRLMEV